jgi:hypothetical protein
VCSHEDYGFFIRFDVGWGTSWRKSTLAPTMSRFWTHEFMPHLVLLLHWLLLLNG